MYFNQLNATASACTSTLAPSAIAGVYNASCAAAGLHPSCTNITQVGTPTAVERWGTYTLGNFRMTQCSMRSALAFASAAFGRTAYNGQVLFSDAACTLEVSSAFWVANGQCAVTSATSSALVSRQNGIAGVAVLQTYSGIACTGTPLTTSEFRAGVCGAMSGAFGIVYVVGNTNGGLWLGPSAALLVGLCMLLLLAMS